MAPFKFSPGYSTTPQFKHADGHQYDYSILMVIPPGNKIRTYI
jgi:hypothetical protein